MYEIILAVLTQVVDTIKSLPENEIFIGLLFTGLISVSLYLLRNIPQSLLRILINNACLQVTFDESSIKPVLVYCYTLRHLFGPKSLDITIWDDLDDFQLGSGTHIKLFQRTVIVCYVDVTWSEYTGTRYVTLTVVFVTRRNSVIENFVREVYKKSYGEDIKIYVPDKYWWRVQKTTDPRNPESLFFSNNVGFELIDDVKKWRDSREFYEKYGIPYRRGYLLYGKPGTGKSSVITSIADVIKGDVYYFDPATVSDNQQMLELISSIKPYSVLVIEDIDASFGEQDNNKHNGYKRPGLDSKQNGITFSGLLNIFDGLLSFEKIVVVFTTNHIEKLDDALIRIGRIDRRFEFKFLETEDIKRMACFFNISLDDDTLRSLEGKSQSEIQEKLIAKYNSYPKADTAKNSKLIMFDPGDKLFKLPVM